MYKRAAAVAQLEGGDELLVCTALHPSASQRLPLLE
jgi:hypothetical protein